MEIQARLFTHRLVARPMLVAAFTLAAATAAPAPAAACSVVPYPAEFLVGPSFAAPSPPPPLHLASVDLKRARYAPPGNGDCGDLGSLILQFVQADGTTWPTDYGIRLTVTAGTRPDPFTIPGSAMATTDGALVFHAGDDPSLPIDFKLAAVAVNAAGVESAPIEIHVSHGGSGGGCSTVGSAGEVPAVIIASVIVLGMALARRRRVTG